MSEVGVGGGVGAQSAKSVWITVNGRKCQSVNTPTNNT